MKVLLLCKRRYTNRDLIEDRFGRLFHFPFLLGKRGHECSVVALDYHVKDGASLRLGGVEFSSLPIGAANVFSSLNQLKQRILNWDPDVIIGSGDSYIGALAVWLGKQYHIPTVFDIYDYYPAFGSNRIPGMKALFRYAVANSDLVLSASKPLVEKVACLSPSMSVVLENGVDEEVFSAYPKEAVRPRLGIKSDLIVIGYFGALASSRGVDVLVSAVDALRRDRKDITLMLAGKMEGGFQLPDYTWIDYRGCVAQAVVASYICACDVAVIPYRRDAQIDLSNACKIAEYLACSVPVVSTRVSDYERFFQHCSDALCEPGDAETMAAAIRSQLEKKCVEPFPEHLRWMGLTERLESALIQLVYKVR